MPWRDAINRSLDRYQDHLREIRQDHEASRGLVAAARALACFNDLVLANDVPIRVDDVPNLVDLIRPLTVPERRRLVNPCVPFLGSPIGPVMFVGTEAAFSLLDERNFVLEACALPALWVTGGSGEMLYRLTGYAPYSQGDNGFARFPNEYYQIGAGGHTWTKCEAVIRDAWPRREPPQVPGPAPLWNFGGLFDLSEFPSPKAGGGGAPSDVRQQFLGELIDALNEVCVLVFHGHGNEQNQEMFKALRRTLTARFLGLNDLAAAVNEPVKILSNSGKTKRNLHWFYNGRRLVIWSNALNGNGRPSESYVAALGTLIARALDKKRLQPGVNLPRRFNSEQK